MKDVLGKFTEYDEAAEFRKDNETVSNGSEKDTTDNKEQKSEPTKENTVEKQHEENYKKVKEKSKKKKFNLKKVATRFILVSATSAVVVFSSCNITRAIYKRNMEKTEPIRQQAQYESLLRNESFVSSSMYQIIDQPNTSLDELLNKDKAQYDSYEKYRKMLQAKEQFINPKMDNLQNYENQAVELSYYDINEQMISEWNDLYYEYYKKYIDASTANDQYSYEENKAVFDRICAQLLSANYAIEKYQKEYGNQLVMDMASKVLASKVIDTDGSITADGVTNIQGEYSEDGTMKVTFKYENFGNPVQVTSDDFSNQGYDLVENLAKDIAENNDLRAIDETKVLANDSNYVAPAHKK